MRDFKFVSQNLHSSIKRDTAQNPCNAVFKRQFQVFVAFINTSWLHQEGSIQKLSNAGFKVLKFVGQAYRSK